MNELAAGGGTFAALVVALITLGLGGMVGWWLRKLIAPKGKPDSAHEVGRVWAGWVAFGVCLSLLTRFFGRLDVDSFAVLVAVGGIWIAFGYALGWVYGRFFQFKIGAKHNAAVARRTAMYCAKCGVELPSEAKYCAGCGKAVDELPIVPLAAEQKTEITGGNTTQNTLPQAKPGGSLLQGRTVQVTGGVLAILLLMGAAYWYLVERNMIREPVYKVGDTWTYAFFYELSGDAERNKLIASAPKEETTKVTRVGEAGDIEAPIFGGRFDGLTGRYLWVNDDGQKKKQQAMHFPLEPRKKWDTSWTSEIGNLQTQTHFQIGEWESVTVLAGTFRCLPVHSTVTTKFVVIGSEPSTVIGSVTEWFSAETKHIVKSVDNKTGRVFQELKSYSVTR